jgi:TRAP-type C4-dicarboxylate transport system permease small subunit
VVPIGALGASVRGGNVKALRIAAVLLIVAGVVGLAYGGFTYTRTTHDAKVGPFELSIKDTETVNIPIWAGVGAIVIGGALFFVRTKR